MHYVQAKGILSAGNGMNLYRGCTHGCIYCDSRSRCYHMDHAFEDIEVKENALTLLEDALRRKRSACMLGTGAMTDPYIPLESELGYVRGALSLALRYGFGFTLQTKSDRVLRDIDLLQAINERTKCVVQMTLTTYDLSLIHILLRGKIGLLFGSAAEVNAGVIKVMPIFLVSVPFDAITRVSTAAFYATEKSVLSYVLTFIEPIIMLVLMLMLPPVFGGQIMIWWSAVFAKVITASVSIVLSVRYSAQRNR